MNHRRRVIFLYTELAPYFLAGLERLVRDHPVEVHLVRWPVNKEAPFQLQMPDHVNLVERDSMSNDELVQWARQLDPEVVFASGWVDRGYLKVCRAMRQMEVPTIMCSDTAWIGSAKQRAAVPLAMLWIKGTFSHAWVTGKAQAKYARKLGFAEHTVYKGFYTADAAKFGPLAERSLAEKAKNLPHRFLCVARYIPSKGHQYLIEAFTELCAVGEAGDWELWCVGTGELHPWSSEHARVKHLGFKQADELWKVQQDCTVLVLPSLFEPWGVVVHEHALAGFPLLLSSAVGAGERFLEEGKNGYRFQAGDKDSLKQAVRAIVENSDQKLLDMGRASARLGQKWGPKEWAATVVDLMDGA